MYGNTDAGPIGYLKTTFVKNRFGIDSGSQKGGDNLRGGAGVHHDEEGHQQGGGSHLADLRVISGYFPQVPPRV